MQREIAWAVRHVLANRTRRHVLLSAGADTPLNLVRFLRRVVPHAALELRGIRSLAESIPDAALRRQAVASTRDKAYHVAGACIFATFLPHGAARAYVELVSPLESLYDYLDNLCDRHPAVTPAAYPILHQAIEDALEPDAIPRDYYSQGPEGDDNGYLLRLVLRVQRSLRRVPDYPAALPAFREAARLYAQMQTFKHYPPGERERCSIAWFEGMHDDRFSELEWYEFACAAGSQLQVYAPIYELFAGRPQAVESAYRAYFPAVAALHVLLDSFIDQAEDREHGELNFASLYPSAALLLERFSLLYGDAAKAFAAMPGGAQHAFVLRVMTLFYLSHPKIYTQGLEAQAESLLRAL